MTYLNTDNFYTLREPFENQFIHEWFNAYSNRMSEKLFKTSTYGIIEYGVNDMEYTTSRFDEISTLAAKIAATSRSIDNADSDLNYYRKLSEKKADYKNKLLEEREELTKKISELVADL